MKQRIVGIYKSEEKAKETVQELQVEGHRPEEIVIVVNDKEKEDWLRDETSAKTEKLVENQEETDSSPEKDMSFLDKIKTAFKGQTEFKGDTTANDIKEPFNFTELGLPEEEADRYADAVKNGEIVILAPQVSENPDTPAAGEKNSGNPVQSGAPMSSEESAQSSEDTQKVSEENDTEEKNRER